MESYMNDYIRQLHQHAEESRRLHKLKQEAEAKAKLAESIQKIKRTKPLTDQITELMRSLPPALRNRPWTMAELVNQLAGRYRDRPHTQHVGEALRRLGWQRVRLWADGGDGRRVWLLG